MKKLILSVMFAMGIVAACEAQNYVKVLVYNNTGNPNWIFKTADSTPFVAYNGNVPAAGSPAINVAFQPYTFPIYWAVQDPLGDYYSSMFSGAVTLTTIPLSLGAYSVSYEVVNIGGGNYHFIVNLN